MDMKQAIAAVLEGRDLEAGQMSAVMQAIMGGEASAAQIGGFLVGLRAKGETVEEIAAAARVMRALAAPVDVAPTHLVDTCGTGGDGVQTFNISTACAFVVAGAGARVAKHGNRSVSSRSGSADVLERAGVRIDLRPAEVARCIRELGVGFMFAPVHHGAMRHAVGPRRELGVRTVFNLLGPLTNPAAAPNQVLGVFDAHWLEPLARVLHQLGSRHVMVVHAEDGMDEISLSAATRYAELREGRISTGVLEPGSLGLAPAPVEALRADGPEQSLALLEGVLNGVAGPALDIVLANAAAALYVAGRAESLRAGVELARQSVASGAARRTLSALARLSHELGAEHGE